MITQKMTAKEARDNFTDLLGTVYYGKEVVMVEKKGRPFAVVINPSEYENYQNFKKVAKKRFFELVDEIQAANKDKSFDKIYKDVTKIVEEVRKERYAKGK
ncbi:type II toxin-antitoxin system Phd/YefM family antitoxin [Candidatus Daviesbacteria bacterium]|nr:type II toxin-antitoxin system Phd/YefM family antitoxin [Candidatus Daviesbacteria bacterium]